MTEVVDVIEEFEEIERETIGPQVQKAKAYWENLGPGLVTGASDDDPSGIATYSQSGAAYGFTPLWLTLYSLPLTITVQEMCARIDLATGHGLAANLKKHFPKWVLIITTTLLLIANTINIGVDLGAMARSTQLILPKMPFLPILVFFTFLSLAFQIFLNYRTYAKYLKWLALILISYIVSALSIKGLPWQEIIFNYTIIPHLTFTREGIIILCAFLGTTISPYLFFWQTSQEVEEKMGSLGRDTSRVLNSIRPPRKSQSSPPRSPFHFSSGNIKKEIKKMRSDVISGVALSNLVAFFIIAAGAATLFKAGVTDITSAEQAALALKPFAGEFAFWLFAAGIIGTGMLTVPILAGSAAYALSETFNWKFGLNKTLKNAPHFYGIIIVSMLIGLFLNFFKVDIFTALIATAVINGVIAPLIVALITITSSNPKVMGKAKNGKWATILGWSTVGVMGVVALATVILII